MQNNVLDIANYITNEKCTLVHFIQLYSIHWTQHNCIVCTVLNITSVHSVFTKIFMCDTLHFIIYNRKL